MARIRWEEISHFNQVDQFGGEKEKEGKGKERKEKKEKEKMSEKLHLLPKI